MRTLVIPPAAQRDADAIQMLSAWIAERGPHCTMNVGMWHADGQDEPRAWGILLADVMRHLGNALEAQRGLKASEVIEVPSTAFDNRWTARLAASGVIGSAGPEWRCLRLGHVVGVQAICVAGRRTAKLPFRSVHRLAPLAMRRPRLLR